MQKIGLSSLALAGAVTLSACADGLPTSAQPQLQPSLARAAAQSAGSQLVVFAGKSIPAGFADRIAALGGTVEQAIDPIGVAYVSGLDAAALQTLRSDRGISAVEPEVMLSLIEPEVEAQRQAGDLLSPTDPTQAAYYAFQWNMRQIGADQAWAAGELGSAAVTVGIIDTGLDYTHPDLAGLVDRQRSRSFLRTEDAVVATYLPGADAVFDLQGHGTHVGATVSSNAVIAAGVTSKVTLVGLKVCGSGIVGLTASGCPSGATFAALVYAADNGVDVVNLSLGGLFTRQANPGYTSVINRVFNYVKSKNLTVVVAAGNAATDLDHGLYPIPVFDEAGDATGEYTYLRFPSLYATYCDSPHVVCVSATGPAGFDTTVPNALYFGPYFDVDAPASYTNFGRSAITVAAPGGTGSGFIWAACPTVTIVSTGTSSWAAAVRTYCKSFPTGKGGTSMAAPHVAGLAALMVEKYGKSPARVVNAIKQSADDLGQNGKDPYYGMGRINVARALGL